MDERKLLLLIKDHPVVYNPQYKNYKKLEARNAAWKAIATAMNEDENYCKKRWKNIRAVVIRDYIDPKKQSEYYLKEYLDFYLPFMKSAKLPPGNIVQSEVEDETVVNVTNEETSDPQSAECNLKIEKVFRPRKLYGSNSKSNSRHYEQPKSDYYSRSSSPIDDADYIRCQSPPSKRIVPEEKFNCDKSFLTSIYDDFRTLDARRKRVLKVKALNLLNELHEAMLSSNSEVKPSRQVEFTLECRDLKRSSSFEII